MSRVLGQTPPTALPFAHQAGIDVEMPGENGHGDPQSGQQQRKGR